MDVTCGEMAVGLNLLRGQQSEWALLKRHPSEDCFGIQLCGGNSDVMTKVAEVVNTYVDTDFVDLNCGCPIDSITKIGAGSALVRKIYI